ncbi:MAG: hypothetical protein AAGF12_35445 [Myxococcota bacterium]
MAKINTDDLTITGAHEGKRDSNVDIRGGEDDGTIIVVTRAFGPNGDNLVGIEDVTFDGEPAVTIGVRVDGEEGLVHLSPIHGDPRKRSFREIPVGAKCELFCPVSKKPLPRMTDVDDGSGAAYFALYLTPKMEDGAMVMVSDIWGHYHSRIVDDTELISYWASRHEELEA